MRNNVTGIEERQFITKEFADTLAGKTPAPYLRVHDLAQQAVVALGQYDLKNGSSRADVNSYVDRMIHFWREISLAALPRAGKAMDECFALLFESTFTLAQAEPAWASDYLSNHPESTELLPALRVFANQVRSAPIRHSDLVWAFTQMYAPRREETTKWENPVNVALAGQVWFRAAILLANTPDSDWLSTFHCAIRKSAAANWNDSDRLHIRLIRQAPLRAPKTSQMDLMAHPILRIARLKYREGSIEQIQVLRFLNARCIKERFESEEDCFARDLTLAHWVRDAREWATNLLNVEPEVCDALCNELGETTIDRLRIFYRDQLGSHPSDVDSLDATAALMKWATEQRGFQNSQYRGQLWEFLVEIVDTALWLGWLFPAVQRH
ncbi:MAG: hypothetical protein WA183_01800 [Chthoniobacterales bacterium]